MKSTEAIARHCPVFHTKIATRHVKCWHKLLLKLKMLRFYPETTKVIFLDLEYYVPKADRGRASYGGMSFSPFLPGHRIIGGVFQTYFPMQDRLEAPHGFWEWELGSEAAVLRTLYQHLGTQWRSISKQSGSLMLAGIGISHSDIPALLARMVSAEVAPPENVHDLLCGCRQIDLSVATFCQFSFNQSYFAYPKTKAALYQKYMPNRKMESGTIVWDAYDAKNYQAIESRCRQEIDDMLAIYKAMVDLRKHTDSNLKRLKRFEKIIDQHPELLQKQGAILGTPGLAEPDA